MGLEQYTALYQIEIITVQTYYALSSYFCTFVAQEQKKSDDTAGSINSSRI